MKQSRIKAVAGEKYEVDGVKYIALDTHGGCAGCVADDENDNLCDRLPLCSGDNFSVIFKG